MDSSGTPTRGPDTQQRQRSKNGQRTALINGDVRLHFELEQELGRGAYGRVRRAKKRASSGLPIGRSDAEHYAIKIMDATKWQTAERQDFFKECMLLAEVEHPNIVRLDSVYRNSETYPNGQTKLEFAMVTEYCNGGELFNVIQKGRFDELRASLIMEKLMRALEHLHLKGIAHRDIKPENICLVQSGDGSGETIKLIDFGFAQLRRRNDRDKNNALFRTRLGSPNYVAPEILRGKPYDEKVDIWSSGVVLFVMLCGNFPFHGHNEKEMFNKIVNEDMDMRKNEWAHISAAGQDFVCRLMTKNAAHRPSAHECLQHPWITRRYELLRTIQERKRPIRTPPIDILKPNSPFAIKASAQKPHQPSLLARLRNIVRMLIAVKRMEYRSSKSVTIFDVMLIIKARRQRRYDKFLSLVKVCAPPTPPALSPSVPGRIKAARGGRRSSPRTTPRRTPTRIRTNTPDQKAAQISPYTGNASPSPVPPIPLPRSFVPREPTGYYTRPQPPYPSPILLADQPPLMSNKSPLDKFSSKVTEYRQGSGADITVPSITFSITTSANTTGDVSMANLSKGSLMSHDSHQTTHTVATPFPTREKQSGTSQNTSGSTRRPRRKWLGLF